MHRKLLKRQKYPGIPLTKKNSIPQTSKHIPGKNPDESAKRRTNTPEDPNHSKNEKRDFHHNFGLSQKKPGGNPGVSQESAKDVPRDSQRSPAGSRDSPMRRLTASRVSLSESWVGRGGVMGRILGSPTNQKKKIPRPATSCNFCPCGHLWVTFVENCFSFLSSLEDSE